MKNLFKLFTLLDWFENINDMRIQKMSHYYICLLLFLSLSVQVNSQIDVEMNYQLTTFLLEIVIIQHQMSI